jgi:hypothetical protein
MTWIEEAVQWASQDASGQFADGGQAIARLLRLGAQREDIASIARMVAYEAVFGVLSVIDDGLDPEHLDDESLPGWLLIEDDPTNGPTGRVVGGLHEDILMMDPSGREGRPDNV